MLQKSIVADAGVEVGLTILRKPVVADAHVGVRRKFVVHGDGVWVELCELLRLKLVQLAAELLQMLPLVGDGGVHAVHIRIEISRRCAQEEREDRSAHEHTATGAVHAAFKE